MKKNLNWIKNNRSEEYFKKSKIEGFRSRSAFKLIELDNKFKFLKENINLLDIGSSPGGWSQVAKNKIKKGKIISLDIQDMEKIENVIFFKIDFLNPEIDDIIKTKINEKFDVIISDMAENTTGNKNLDCVRTNNLAFEVIEFSLKHLQRDGSVVSKLFMGEDFIKVKDYAKKKFKKVDFFKPKSSKKESKETYIHLKTIKTL